jgi:hypothetical protein
VAEPRGGIEVKPPPIVWFTNYNHLNKAKIKNKKPNKIKEGSRRKGAIP